MICVCLIVVYEALSNAFLKSVYIRSILSSRITPLAAEFDSRTSFQEPKLFICKQIICDKMFHTHRCAAPTTKGAKIALLHMIRRSGYCLPSITAPLTGYFVIVYASQITHKQDLFSLNVL